MKNISNGHATTTPLRFKIVDVRDSDKNGRYQLQLFGRTQDGKSVASTMTNYSPNFFVKLKKGWSDDTVRMFYRYLNYKLASRCGKHVVVGDIVALSKVYGNSNYYVYGSVIKVEAKAQPRRTYSQEGESDSFGPVESTLHVSVNGNIRTVSSYTVDKICMYHPDRNTVCDFKDYEEFTGGESEKFMRLVFPNMKSFKAAKYALQYPVTFAGIRKPTKLETYEANIEPCIRCLHSADITPCGWVTVEDYELIGDSDSKLQNTDDSCDSNDSEDGIDGSESNDCAKTLDLFSTRRTSRCDIEIRCDWKAMKPEVTMNAECVSAPLRIMSYDIECNSSDPTKFPSADKPNDAIFQIACTFNLYQQKDCYRRVLLCYKSTCLPKLTDADDSTELMVMDSEKDLLLAFTELVKREDPDVITGYFITGFDNKYLYDRAEKLNIGRQFSQLSRLRYFESENRKWTPSSSGMGDNIMYVPECHGRVVIDLNKVLTMNLLSIGSLSSYKLDSVAQTFYRGPINNLQMNASQASQFASFETKPTQLEVGSYIYILQIEKSTNIEWILEESKFKVVSIDEESGGKLKITVDMKGYNLDNLRTDGITFEWSLAKDDIEPTDIFKSYNGTAEERGIIGKYCVKDAVLVNLLFEQLEVLGTTMELANVTRVPLYYIFLRGQGVKSYSLISYGCKQRAFVMKDLDKNAHQDDMKFNGAAVFDPQPGVHHEPVVVNDFSSLYPSEIIAMNMSKETHVHDTRYMGLENYRYQETSYEEDGVEHKEIFAQEIDSDGNLVYGTIPSMLMTLLSSRKAVKRAMKTEKSEEKVRNMSGREKALKITANSIYGQLGAKTSDIYHRPIAACTTAGGKRRLYRARDFVIKDLVQLWTELDENKDIGNWVKHVKNDEKRLELESNIRTTHSKFTIRPELVYGDTDSIFVKYNIEDRDQEYCPTELETRERAMNMGMIVGELTKAIFPSPHDLEYEKVYHPLVSITKKRYTGRKFENDQTKFKTDSMGIVTKRRDNAKIVKVVIGNIVDKLLNSVPTDDIIEYTKSIIKSIEKQEFDPGYFVTTKSIKDLSKYKDPNSLVHTRLAMRMIERDPSSAPQPNERLAYLYVLNKKFYDKKTSNILQGDRVEEYEYFVKNREAKGMKIDYVHYITNQIQSPACQLLDLIMPRSQELIFKPLVDRMISDIQGKTRIESFFAIRPNSEVSNFDISLG